MKLVQLITIRSQVKSTVHQCPKATSSYQELQVSIFAHKRHTVAGVRQAVLPAQMDSSAPQAVKKAQLTKTSVQQAAGAKTVFRPSAQQVHSTSTLALLRPTGVSTALQDTIVRKAPPTLSSFPVLRVDTAPRVSQWWPAPPAHSTISSMEEASQIVSPVLLVTSVELNLKTEEAFVLKVTIVPEDQRTKHSLAQLVPTVTHSKARKMSMSVSLVHQDITAQRRPLHPHPPKLVTGHPYPTCQAKKHYIFALQVSTVM